MVEIDDIKSTASFETWLDQIIDERGEEEGRRIAVVLAHRAAMRVLPILWAWVEHEETIGYDYILEAHLRVSFICGAAGVWPTPWIRDVATAADRTFVTAYKEDYAAYPHVTFSAASAISALTSVTYIACTTRAVSNASVVLDAYDISALWPNIRSDALTLVTDSGMQRPLWQDDNPLEHIWHRLHTDLLHTGDWDFWVRWYAAALDGSLCRPQNKALLTEIALIDDEDWEKGAGHIANMIAEMEQMLGPLNSSAAAPKAGVEAIEVDDLERLKQASYSGFIVSYNPDTDKLREDPVPATAPDALTHAINRLTEMQELVQQSHNLEGILRAELFLMSRATTHYADNAAMVYQNSHSALMILQGNIANESLPTPAQEPVIGAVETTLIEVIAVMRQEPDVEKVYPRPTDTPLLDNPEALEIITDVAKELAGFSEGDMATNLRDEVKIINDNTQPREIRTESLTTTASRVAQTLSLGAKMTDDMRKITMNVTKISTVTGGALYGIAHSDKIRAAFEWLKMLF